ncbi:hypothetical protein D3C76_165780 [compost metagenome]
MQTITQLVNTYAASPRNPPKGYGSIDAGIAVMRYRSTRLGLYQSQGLDYTQAATLAQRDVISVYGEPWVSVDEDGIPI